MSDMFSENDVPIKISLLLYDFLVKPTYNSYNSLMEPNNVVSKFANFKNSFGSRIFLVCTVFVMFFQNKANIF